MVSRCPVKYEKEAQLAINFLKAPSIVTLFNHYCKDLYFNTKLMGYNSRQINEQLGDYTFIKSLNFFKTIRFIEVSPVTSLIVES
jgi:hypothetical protein